MEFGFVKADGVPPIFEKSEGQHSGREIVDAFLDSGLECAVRECADRNEAMRLAQRIRACAVADGLPVTVNQRKSCVYLSRKA